MEMFPNPINKVYEVEKIINCKFYKNKKYYLIKWLCYPISESTWEPKSNIKHLSAMLDKFEEEYPYSVGQNMYNIFCSEVKKTKKRSKRVQKSKEIPTGIKSLSKARKIEGFSKAELKDILYEKLKNHLFINITKRHINFNKVENKVVIGLSTCDTSFDEENNSIYFHEKENLNGIKEKNDGNKLIKPIIA